MPWIALILVDNMPSYPSWFLLVYALAMYPFFRLQVTNKLRANMIELLAGWLRITVKWCAVELRNMIQKSEHSSKKSSDRRFATERTKIMYGNPTSFVQISLLHHWKNTEVLLAQVSCYLVFVRHFLLLTRQVICMFTFQSENHDPARLLRHPQT